MFRGGWDRAMASDEVPGLTDSRFDRRERMISLSAICLRNWHVHCDGLMMVPVVCVTLMKPAIRSASSVSPSSRRAKIRVIFEK
jgi:hypothetical protein